MLQPFLGGTGQDSGLNRIEHILDTRFRIPELLLVEGKVGVLPVLQLHDLGNNGFHGSIVPDKLHGLVDHQIFQPLFADGFLFAALVLFGSGTFIIAVDFSCPARTTFAKHQRTAAAAVQLGCQQVIILCLSPGRGFLIFGNLLLHIVEKLRGHNGGNRIGNQDVTIFQLTNIAAVAQHVLDGVESHRPAALVLDSFLVQPVPDLPHGLTIVVPLKGFSYKRCGQWVDLKTAVGIDGVPEWNRTTGKLAFEGIFRHATNDLFRKIGGVVFRIALQHRFQNDALRPLGDNFRCRHEFDTVLLQLGLVPCAIVAVSGKAIKFPDQHDVKQLLIAVFYHLLELRTIVRLGRDGTVDVVLDDSDSVLFGIRRAFTDLTLDGFFTLVVTGIAGVNYGGHGKHLSFYIIERWSVLSEHCFV